MHDLRVKLGARPVHVAEYAKKWETFYKVLRKNVMINAVNYARQNGYEAVTCGHTHYAEDRVFNNMRYINTGAWTEFPAFYLLVTAGEMTLKRIEPSFKLPEFFQPRSIRSVGLPQSRGRQSGKETQQGFDPGFIFRPP